MTSAALQRKPGQERSFRCLPNHLIGLMNGLPRLSLGIAHSLALIPPGRRHQHRNRDRYQVADQASNHWPRSHDNGH